MDIRIAGVSFLNTVPLVDLFETHPIPGVSLVRAVPSRLPDLLGRDLADVALLPVVEAFRIPAAVMLLGTGIACRGDVGSVKLFATRPPGELREIHVDRGSRTSVALLRILLAEVFEAEPVFVEAEPRADGTPDSRVGHLVIGDRCFAFEKTLDRARWRSWDLGGLWLRFSGLPFVFAAWTASGRFADRVGPAGLATVRALLDDARDHGLDRLDELAGREAAAGRLGVGGEATSDAIAYYFQSSLRFRLDRDEWAGVRRFHECCVARGLVPQASFPATA